MLERPPKRAALASSAAAETRSLCDNVARLDDDIALDIGVGDVIDVAADVVGAP